MALALVGDPTGASACSIRRDWLHRPGTYLLATALADTVRAGPGSVEHHPGPDSPAVYGQVARLERAGGDIPPALARALRAGADEAVLVPWSYDASCRTSRWRGEMPWVEPGITGLFSAVPREESEWVGGRPTFDVFAASHEPYPHGSVLDRRHASQGAALTAEQLFDLFGVLPTWQEVEAEPCPAVAPFLRWARENPELARLYPVPWALESAYAVIQPCVSRVYPGVSHGAPSRCPPERTVRPSSPPGRP